MSKALIMAAVSAGIQFMGGREQISQQRKAAEFEARQLQDQKDLSAIEAIQEENLRREKLQELLSTRGAQAAGQGQQVSFFGGNSFVTGNRDARGKAGRDIRNIRVMGQARAKQYGLGIEQTLKAGEEQQYKTAFSTLSSMASTGMSAYKTGVFNSGPKNPEIINWKNGGSTVLKG